MKLNEETIQQLYTSFQQLDAEAMRSCYHSDAIFSDPVFPELKGNEIGAMWSMLVGTLKKNPEQWKLDFKNIQVEGTAGSCRWEAHYTFSLTGRRIHNIIDARFEFRDGKIIRHTDTFDVYRWARMAFGLTGTLIGWTGFFKKALQRKTNQRLRQFIHRVEA